MFAIYCVVNGREILVRAGFHRWESAALWGRLHSSPAGPYIIRDL